MRNPPRKFARSGGQWNMQIKGRIVNIHVAHLTYRCEECLGPLKRQGFGLACRAETRHKGFIPQDQALELERQQEAKQKEVESVFEIVEGQIRPKVDPIERIEQDATIR